MTQKLLIATRNPGKQREIREILADLPYDVVFPEEIGLWEEPAEGALETETTFEGNALRKAEYFYRRSRLPTVGEDSGIEVLALGGEPGVRSKRFALATGDQDEANNTELLRRLAGAPNERRGARYRCAIVLVRDPPAIPRTFEGSCAGRILTERRGTGGFGYDPLFYSNDLEKSFGEATPEEKHGVSHRGRAFHAFAEWLKSHPL
jgi:XTP/dITP diphosphohydrolase